MNKKIFTCALAATALMAALPAHGVETLFSYSNASDPAGYMAMPYAGTTDTYECCIFLQNDGYVKAGAKIVGIKTPAISDGRVTDYVAWVATELPKVPQGQLTPYLVSKEGTPTNSYLEIRFDEPITLPEEGIYIGYSMRLTGTAAVSPMAVTYSDVEIPHSMYVRTNGALYSWKDYYNSFHKMDPPNGRHALQVILDGDFTDAAAQPTVGDTYGVVGSSCELDVTLTNTEAIAITNVDYVVTVEGLEPVQGHVELFPTISSAPGSTGSFKVTLPAHPEEGGVYPGEIVITSVNGKENTSNIDSDTFRYIGVDHRPVHRPVMQEYTGTWCGWCPRGMAGLSYLSANIDDFIGMAIHGGSDEEVMRVGENFFGKEVRSYPSMEIDRVITGDPWYGTSTAPAIDRFIYNDYMARKAVFAPADIEISADWDDDGEMVIAKTEVNFVVDPLDESTYSLAYVLLADGLTGPDDDMAWSQANYFNIYDSDYYYQYPELQVFCDLPQLIPGYIFNDVVVFGTMYEGLPGSLPAVVKRNQKYNHTYTIPLEDCLNQFDQPMVQNPNRLTAIVMVVKELNGKTEIVNGAKVKVPNHPTWTSLNEAMTENVVSEEYYTPAGVRVAAPGKGIYVKVSRMADGSARSSKVLLK